MKNSVICNDVVITIARWLITVCLIGNSLLLRMICNPNNMIAGPEAKAEAMNLGASKAVCQKARPEFAENRNAVTVWIEIAQRIAMITNGK